MGRIHKRRRTPDLANTRWVSYPVTSPESRTLRPLRKPPSMKSAMGRPMAMSASGPSMASALGLATTISPVGTART